MSFRADATATNRPAATNAFNEETRRAFQSLSQQPLVGPLVADARLPGVRRIDLSRIHYHLYYRESSDGQAVEILALWHSKRGTGPGV